MISCQCVFTYASISLISVQRQTNTIHNMVSHQWVFDLYEENAQTLQDIVYCQSIFGYAWKPDFCAKDLNPSREYSYLLVWVQLWLSKFHHMSQENYNIYFQQVFSLFANLMCVESMSDIFNNLDSLQSLTFIKKKTKKLMDKIYHFPQRSICIHQTKFNFYENEDLQISKGMLCEN